MPVKPTPARQERSAATFERALAAGAELLAEQGYEGFTMQEVCRRAQVSTSSLYARVDGKDTLVRLIHERETAAIQARFEAALGAVDWTELSAADAVATAVAAVGDTFRDNAALLRTFILRSSFDPVIHDRAHASIAATGQAFAAALLTHRAEIAHDDPEAAVDMVFRVAFATFTRQLTRGPAFDSTHAAGWDELTSQLTRMCAGYLLEPF